MVAKGSTKESPQMKYKKHANDMAVAMRLCNEGRFESALPYFEKAIAADRNNDEAHRMKGQALMMLGRLQDATDSVIDALNINPQNVWSLILMGNILIKQRDIESAMRYYEKALQYHPDDVIAINNVAAACVEQGLLDKALETFNRALEIDDSYPNTYYGKALVLEKQGKDREAWEILQKAGTAAMPRAENPRVIEEMNKAKLSIAHRLASGGDGLRAIGATIKELKELGGIDIKTEPSDKMSLSAKLEYAKIHGRDFHRIIFNQNRPYHEHLILHELTHLRMAINASKAGKNEVPITDSEQVKAFHQKFAFFFNKLIVRIGAENAQKVEKDIRNGLALQLFNCPLDLLVEDYIFGHYPELRPLQLLSLFSQEEENINSVRSVEKAKVFPPEVVRANKLMNLVSSLHLEELYGINLQNYYKPTRTEFDRAKMLYAMYKACRDSYEPGEEYELCRRFIDALGFGDLIVWVNEDAGHLDESMLHHAKESMPSEAEIAERNKEFVENHKDGADSAETMMMAMYMLGAMERFDKMQHLEVRKAAMEIAIIGMTGINPNKKSGYRVPSFGDEDFGGYRLLAYYYVGFAREMPEVLPQLSLPFSNAYKLALQMREKKK